MLSTPFLAHRAPVKSIREKTGSMEPWPKLLETNVPSIDLNFFNFVYFVASGTQGSKLQLLSTHVVTLILKIIIGHL